SFEVEDEPYFIELQDPGSTEILLTADYGASGDWPVVGELYPADTSLQSDGKTRVIGYTRPVGQGGIAYVALGHCHNPAIPAARAGGARPLAEPQADRRARRRRRPSIARPGTAAAHPDHAPRRPIHDRRDERVRHAVGVAAAPPGPRLPGAAACRRMARAGAE